MSAAWPPIRAAAVFAYCTARGAHRTVPQAAQPAAASARTTSRAVALSILTLRQHWLGSRADVNKFIYSQREPSWHCGGPIGKAQCH